MITVTEAAAAVLRRSVGAARRFEEEAGIRACRGGSTIDFTLATAPEPGDATVESDGFVLWVEAGLDGTVDVGDHDRLVIR
ncbi:MAG: hypothetical protein ACKOI0_00535 [Actinomycetota bacterium]